MDRSEPLGTIRVKPMTTLRGQEGEPHFSPDAEQVAFVLSRETDDNFNVYVKRID